MAPKIQNCEWLLRLEIDWEQGSGFTRTLQIGEQKEWKTISCRPGHQIPTFEILCHKSLGDLITKKVNICTCGKPSIGVFCFTFEFNFGANKIPCDYAELRLSIWLVK